MSNTEVGEGTFGDLFCLSAVESGMPFPSCWSRTDKVACCSQATRESSGMEVGMIASQARLYSLSQECRPLATTLLRCLGHSQPMLYTL